MYLDLLTSVLCNTTLTLLVTNMLAPSPDLYFRSNKIGLHPAYPVFGPWNAVTVSNG